MSVSGQKIPVGTKDIQQVRPKRAQAESLHLTHSSKKRLSFSPIKAFLPQPRSKGAFKEGLSAAPCRQEIQRKEISPTRRIGC
jgi:hypothetical protein